MQESSISKKKVSIINLAINYANTFFLIINGLILVPIYFEYFSLSIYGSYLAVANIAAILGLLEFGLSLVLTQKLSILYKKNDYHEFTKTLWSGLVASLGLISILIIIAVIILPFVPGWVKADPIDSNVVKQAFIINSVGLGLNIFSNTLTSIFQAWSKVKLSGIINVCSAFFGIVATMLGLYLGLGIASISLGIFTKGLLCVLGLLPFLLKNYRKEDYPKAKIDFKSISSLLRESSPVFGNTVSKQLIDNGQLLIITSFINPTAAAVYSLTCKVYQVCSNLLAPIGSSIFSSLSQLVGENDSVRLKSSILTVLSLFTLFSTIILSISFAVNSSFVMLWVGGDKYGGLTLSLILCVNTFISSRFAYLNFNLFALGVFGKTVYYDQIGAILRLLLIFVSIRYFGIISIPVSELAATLFSGYFLYKLFINRMQFDRNEIRKVVFFGLVEFTTLLIIGVAYQYFVPTALSWRHFMFESFGIIAVMFLLLFALNKEFFYRLYFSSTKRRQSSLK